VQVWLGWTAQFSADPAAALGHFTAVRDAVADRPPSQALAAALAGRAGALRLMGRAAEAAGDARRALALARQIGDPVGELQALVDLSFDAHYAGDHAEAVRLARQAGQITAGIPVSLTRMCSRVLTIVLADAGETGAAETVGAAALVRARAAGDLWNQADLLPRIADLDLRAGRVDDAAVHLREGLQIAVRTGSRFDWFDLLWGLSLCGSLCAATGRAGEALTLWAACTALERHQGVTDPAWFKPRREEQLRQARQALGPGRARAAEDRGAAMSLATAAEYALMLTDPVPPQPAAPDPGTLSARERELVTLVARGRTNAEIAAELYISVRTVGSHLDRIRDKTGCRRRADLTRLALTTGLV
jgi:DNA-binding CsgD family transcriptional regulator/tetratricopeptide (TPR) repeat protein